MYDYGKSKVIGVAESRTSEFPCVGYRDGLSCRIDGLRYGRDADHDNGGPRFSTGFTYGFVG